MPSVVNGIGTWYYGKKNLQTYTGVCRNCGRATTLTSYDTGLYFVFFMIPLIPLGRRRIIEQCGLCRRHGVMPMSRWRLAQAHGQAAIAEWRAAKDDPEKATEALGALAAFRDLPQFLQIAPEIESSFAGNAKMLCTLASIHLGFGRADDYERLLRAAHTVEDSEEVREAVGDSLVRRGKPEEAEPYFCHIVEKGIPDRVDQLYRLAQEYQAQGKHDKALEVFGQCEAVNPTVLNDSTFVRLRDASAQKRGTSKPVLPTEVVRKAKASQSRRKFLKAAPVVIGLAVLGYAGVSLIEGLRAPVWLVNGLERMYVARVNGAMYEVPPHNAIKIRLAEGNVKVEITDPAAVPAETVAIHSSFWMRPFTAPTFVLNPDHAAVIRDSKIFYAEGTPPAPQSSFAGGKALLTFDDIDYPFSDPPRTISAESSSSAIQKRTLAIVNKDERVPADVLLYGLAETLGKETVKHMAQRHLLLEPERQAYLNVLQRMAKPAEVAELLRPSLIIRPLRMSWHRAYQSAMQEAGQDQQAEQEYTQMLASEPKNTELIYLAGRASRDIDRCFSLYQQAASADPPCAYAFYSLCGYFMSNGQYHEAVTYATRAMELIKDDRDVHHYGIRALTADGQYDAALKLIKADEKGNPTIAINACLEELYVQRLRNDPVAAVDAIRQIRDICQKFMPDYTDETVATAEAIQAYVIGDTKTYIEKESQSKSDDGKFCALITDGKLHDAEELLKTMDESAYGHGLIYLKALQQKNPEVAQRHLADMIRLLSKGDFDDRAFAAAIELKPTMPLKDLLRQHGFNQRKAVYLTVLGTRDLANRQACFDLAKKLNYDKRFPYLLLKSALESQ
jgi:tetratricopeptide (TPR) repeat protein